MIRSSNPVDVNRFLLDVGSATFNAYDQPARDRLQQARTVLLAMQEQDRLWFARLGADLCNAIPAQGMGPVTVFEVLVALGRLMEREANGGKQ